MGIIYMLTSPSGKSYVGQTVQELAARIGGHRCRSRCFAIGAAIKKYGIDAFNVVVLAIDIPTDLLDYAEDAFIVQYGTMKPNGYNLIRGRPEPGKAERYARFKDVAKEFTNRPEFKEHKRELWKDPAWAAAWRETWMKKRAVKLSKLDGRAHELRLLDDKRNDRVVAKRKAMKDPAKKAEWDEMYSNDAILERRNQRFFDERLAKIQPMSDEDALAYLRKAKAKAMKATRLTGAVRTADEVHRWYPEVTDVQGVRALRARG